MARHDESVRAHRPKQSAAPRRPHGAQAPTPDRPCAGAAAQLAAVHRTLRHGPVLQLQPGGTAAGARPAAASRAPAPNRTGLPDRLKSGVEALSGLSLDDVRVHRNSARPAALEAHAYTQGSEIHLAPGQERHLPHEAWHVVQQKQGRVKPTLQMKGIGVNDDAGLEREADAMGARAALGPSAGAALTATAAAPGRATVQRNGPVVAAQPPAQQPAQQPAPAPAPVAVAAPVVVEAPAIKVKTLSSAEAKQQWLGYTKPKYKMTGKFEGDHLIDQVSNTACIKASIERFAKNMKLRYMTWSNATERNLLAKAPGGDKMAHVYQQGQQLTTTIKNIAKGTVEVSTLDRKKAEQMDKKYIREHDKQFYHFQYTPEAATEMYVSGAWNPAKGKAELYHYANAQPGSDEMLQPYRRWRFEGDTVLGPEVTE